MNVLIAGNSHIVGLKNAFESNGLTSATFLPIPLCDNFEEVVKSKTGPFKLNPGWKNMKSIIGEKKLLINYDFTHENNILVFIGMHLFGAYPVLGPLLSSTYDNNRPFIIYPGKGKVKIPYHPKYLILSKSCLEEVFKSKLFSSISDYKWLFKNFNKVYWIPSPPPNKKWAKKKIMYEHKWYINSGLHYNLVSIFNTCIVEVNKKTNNSSSSILTFVPIAEKGVNKEDGFLLPEYAHNPNIEDIHASKEYYKNIIAKSDLKFFKSQN